MCMRSLKYKRKWPVVVYIVKTAIFFSYSQKGLNDLTMACTFYLCTFLRGNSNARMVHFDLTHTEFYCCLSEYILFR